jgi:hypothetical protein
MANILLVTTPTAETLGAGFPQMMAAEDTSSSITWRL